MDLRHAFDISPWNSQGSSFLGMKRENAKRIALALLGIGFLLSELAVYRSLTSGKYGVGSRHFKAHNGKFRKK